MLENLIRIGLKLWWHVDDQIHKLTNFLKEIWNIIIMVRKINLADTITRAFLNASNQSVTLGLSCMVEETLDPIQSTTISNHSL